MRQRQNSLACPLGQVYVNHASHYGPPSTRPDRRHGRVSGSVIPEMRYERARLRTVLIMIVNNNRARHRRLPDVTRALYRLRTPPSAQRLDRRENDYLSIISTHTHTIGFWFASHSYSLLFASGDRTRRRACGFDRLDFINTVATMRVNMRASEFSRVRTWSVRHAAPSCIVTVIGYLGCSTTDAFGSNL